MRRKVAGVPIYVSRSVPGVQRPRTWTPDFSGRYGWTFGRWIVWVSWNRYTGYRPTGAWLDGSGWPGTRHDVSSQGSSRVKKPNAATPEVKPEEVKPYESKVLKAFPRLIAFLTDDWYDDGTRRKRGSLIWGSEGSFVTVMIKEPTPLLCARIRAASIDDAYKALELFLGLDSPPWEPDEFARERAAPKKKK